MTSERTSLFRGLSVPSPRSRFLRVIAVAVLVLAAGFAGVILYALYNPSAPGEGRPVRITVSQGEPFSSVMARLAEARLVHHPKIVGLYSVLRGLDRNIRAGTYEFEPGDRAVDVLGRLVRGEVLESVVTVPEGLNIWETASILAEEAGVDSAAFVAIASSPETPREMGIAAPTLEGYLFPDTYVIPWGMEPGRMVSLMTDRFREVFGDSLRERAESLGMSVEEVVTLASIIEAETALPEERPLVSAVYHNRLARGMRLEADPTVAYAKRGYRGRLNRRDLSIDSPYNTYLHPGLPPGAICNPGEASLKAALYPAQGFGALYFVARGDGGHVFSLTLKEHLDAVAHIKKRRAAGR